MSATSDVLLKLLLLRRPEDFERPDIHDAVCWVRRFGALMFLVYLVWIGVTVVPALLRERSLPYYVFAIVVPHLLLWVVASSVARAWIGFRYYDVYPQAKTRMYLWIAGVSAVLGFLVGFFEDRALGKVFRLWFSETFGSMWWLLALVVVLSLWPEMIARMRGRERRQMERVAAAETAAERLGRHTAESELRLLQAQVEPHFIYNTLANVRYLIQKGSADALRMTDALIEYLRTSVPDMRADKVTLAREIDHVRNYLEIMQMRMPGRLQFAIEAPPELRSTPMPPLVLLTLVENALKHGIAAQVEGGSIEIAARCIGDDLEIEVADTGRGPADAEDKEEAPSTRSGLANARGRLQLTYGDRATLALVRREPRGTRAIARFPRLMPTAIGRSVPSIARAPWSNVAARDLRPALREPIRRFGPKRQWAAEWHGHQIRVVDSWFGGAELFVDNELRDTYGGVFALPDGPVLQALIDDPVHGEGRVAVYLQPWSFHVRAAIEVSGQRIGGDAI